MEDRKAGIARLLNSAKAKQLESIELHRATVITWLELGELLNDLKSLVPQKQWGQYRAKISGLKATKDETCRKFASKKTEVLKELGKQPEITISELRKILSDPRPMQEKGFPLVRRSHKGFFEDSFELWKEIPKEPKDLGEKDFRQNEINSRFNKIRRRYEWRPTKNYGCHFLDSGAYGKYLREKVERHGREFYESEEFFQYLDSYAGFVKKYKAAIDFYANVDARREPEISWRNQKYLEVKHGLSPVPVIHYPAESKWLRHYLDRGHELIGLSCESKIDDAAEAWLDDCFEAICDVNGKPRVKVHGFGITSFRFLRKYPWSSADSTTWRIDAGNGLIWIPKKDGEGNFCFDEDPEKVYVGAGSRKEGFQDSKLDEATRKKAQEWLANVGVPFGKNKKVKIKENGKVKEEWVIQDEGAINSGKARTEANVVFMENFRASLR